MSSDKNINIISHELNLSVSGVLAVVQLLDQGATIPFIARYRKEKTGSLDEVAITAIRDRTDQLKALDDRKSAVIHSLTKRELLTRELETAVHTASSLSLLEDLYEKYRPKKRTRAHAAREKGLEPLAKALLDPSCADPAAAATPFISVEQEVMSVEDALAGARDIIAETVNEDAAVRNRVRKLFLQSARIQSVLKKGKKEEGQKFKDYFDWSELAFKAPSHRVLAMLRGNREGVLTLHVLPDEAKALQLIEKGYVTPGKNNRQQVQEAIKDGYRRLLSKSIEKECINELKAAADETAIQVFARNLEELLLSPPLGQKRILAVDPGFRTGCKVVCLDAQGQLLHHDVTYLHKGRDKAAQERMAKLIQRYDIQAVAIGNGTAGRETERFIKSLALDNSIQIVMVDESGASIYSASKTARKEFPDHDITVRGAVSIGRRLMDPLAELVKLDPKSIGVGQYQHDVDQKRLQQSLNDVVISCVNRVGVEVNTASQQLLTRVSGLNKRIAENIVQFRQENGPFRSRKELLKVPRLGPKAFEQCAGFLRIHNAPNPLDSTGIHPESYAIVEQMAKDAGFGVKELMKMENQTNHIDLKRYITEFIGLPTLKDIVLELASPGRDPRKEFKSFSFDDSIHEITDLVPGMKIPGIVTNVTAFGAFVDVGVHQDGLVHISQMADRFVKDPNEIVSVRQAVMVTILDVDSKRKRISLSMKKQ